MGVYERWICVFSPFFFFLTFPSTLFGKCVAVLRPWVHTTSPTNWDASPRLKLISRYCAMCDVQHEQPVRLIYQVGTFSTPPEIFHPRTHILSYDARNIYPTIQVVLDKITAKPQSAFSPAHCKCLRNVDNPIHRTDPRINACAGNSPSTQ